MKIDIETLRKTKGFGKKLEDRVMEQYRIDNNIQSEPLYRGEKDFGVGLYNEDALEVLSNIKDNSIDLIFTDPPYRVTSRGSAGNSGGMLQKDINKRGMVFSHNDILPHEYLPQFFRVLKDGSHAYIMSNHINLTKIITAAENCGFHFIKSLIWNKGNKIMGQAYMSQFEYILFFRKGKFKKINFCGTSDILNIPNIKTKDKNGNNIHDTEKPVELTDILIKNSTQEGEIVCDPFMGVGGAGVSCKKLKRDFLGVEIDERYFNSAKKRIEKTLELEL